MSDACCTGRSTRSGPDARRSRPAVGAVTAARAATPADADGDLELLLAERAERLRPVHTPAPTRIPASRFKDFVDDYGRAVEDLRRPMPERPYRQTRLGTLFHAWVEQRSGLVGAGVGLDDDGLWGDDEAGASAADAIELQRLRECFERSEWAALRPLEVETEIDFVTTRLDGREHVVICKLDAVYRRGERYEIVDWKTGRPPASEPERRLRMLQLELYREAYHAKHGIDLDLIDVALFYVGDELVLRG
ncbi:hypothetical protein QE418_000206 [Microbacterium testaceum]|nr:PD-(D/E)XK nuclease family protein [Microbacterium testaceum]MDQ1110758.1 hypothetical protein [Microbacterium testaceum]